MLSEQEVSQVLLAHMRPLLTQQGYLEQEHHLYFVKPFDGGSQRCFFSLAQQDTNIWIECNLAIRVEVVENIANEYLNTIKEYRGNTNTVITSYGKLTGNDYYRFKVNNPTDLLRVCTRLHDFFIDTGFGFLNENTSIYKLDKLINDYPERPTTLISNPAHRCVKGLIIAKLSNNPYLQTLAQAYGFILGKTTPTEQQRQKYNALAKYLLTVSLN